VKHALVPVWTAVVMGLVASASPAHARAPVVNANITETEVLAAQQAWGDALVRISTDFEQGGLPRAKATAEAVIDAAYGYQWGAVLFKPTLAPASQAFRPTREGALSYFVGGDRDFPNDTGFALKGWRAVEIVNAAILINGNMATTMGKVIMTDRDGRKTAVDKTWAFRKDDAGRLRIVVHHSSLPFSAPAAR
jgi:hypothetical protein